MPTRVSRRPGQFPVRVSLNVTQETSEVLDYLERATGEYRGVIAREALILGLVLFNRELERAERRRVKTGGPVCPNGQGGAPTAADAGLDVVSALFPDGVALALQSGGGS